MRRLLVIAAAGRGSRLGWDGPKALCPVASRPMIDFVLERYATLAQRVIVVVAPSSVPAFHRYFQARGGPIETVVQAEPTGMLPAVLCALGAVETCRPDQVWITWCDQIGISAKTVQRLAAELDEHPGAACVFPTVRQAPPYIHFVRDAGGRVVEVLHRRDGAVMPLVGESDAGLFAMRRDVFTRDLAEYAQLPVKGDGTKERHFLPFLPWLAGRKLVRTFDLPDAREATGVNTPEDRRAIEEYLRERE